jgi:fatty acid desaturase
MDATGGAGMGAEDRINWYRSPVEKETMKRLMERRDGRAFAQILPQLALTAATGVGAYWAWDHLAWPLVLLAVYLHGTVWSFVGLSGAGHELCHGTPFKTRLWNEFFLRIVAFLSWTNYAHFRASHAGHHQLTVYPGRDLEVVQPLQFRRRDIAWMLAFNLPALRYALLTLARLSRNRLYGEWESRIFPEFEPKRRREMVNWSRVLLLGHTALAAAFLATGQWRLVLLVTLAPFYGGWLNFLCGFTQHAGLVYGVPDFRLCCRTVRMNPLVRNLYWHMNYHVEHHMYSGVPFYNLAALRQAIEPDVPPAYPGLWAAWKDILLFLRRQKADPKYAFTPALPATARLPPRA